jgi:Tfp pilus assembly protein PilO
MKRFKWMIADSINRLDWTAQLGLALCMFAAVFQFAVSAPMQSRAGQLQREAAAAKKDAENIARNSKRRDIRPVNARFNEFYQYFPSRQSTPDWLQKIYGAAAAQAIQLSQGEYRLVPDKTGKLVGYQINLPVKGSYAQVRKFIVQVLNEVPTASLDELAFRREAIGNAEVEAKIRLTLYLRAQP